MKYFTYLFFLFIGQTSFIFSAVADGGITGLREDKLRRGEVHTEDIPIMIKSAIDILMWIAGTVAVLFIIIWAYKILFGSLQDDKSQGKNTVIMAIWWFILASLAWFIIKFIISNLTGI